MKRLCNNARRYQSLVSLDNSAMCRAIFATVCCMLLVFTSPATATEGRVFLSQPLSCYCQPSPIDTVTNLGEQVPHSLSHRSVAFGQRAPNRATAREEGRGLGAGMRGGAGQAANDHRQASFCLHHPHNPADLHTRNSLENALENATEKNVLQSLLVQEKARPDFFASCIVSCKTPKPCLYS